MAKNIINGGFELVYANRIMLAELASVEIPVELMPNEVIRLIFNIKYDGGDMSAEFRPADDCDGPGVWFELNNFGTPLGTFIKEPIRVGEIRNRDIKIIFDVVKPKDGMPILGLSVYLENKGDVR